MIKQNKKNDNQPALPPTIQLAKNFVKAVYKHVVDGMAKVDVDQYADRLKVCNGCALRSGNRCTHPSCGCFLDKKAWWASEDCPLEKWEKLTINGV